MLPEIYSGLNVAARMGFEHPVWAAVLLVNEVPNELQSVPLPDVSLPPVETEVGRSHLAWSSTNKKFEPSV